MADDLTLRESVQLAVTTEQIGREFYLRMAKKFADSADVAEVFARLANDEKAHEEQFKRILEVVPKEENVAERYELYQYLRATAISEFFSKDTFKSDTAFKTPTEAMAKSLAFEKATLQFYQAIRDLLGENKQLDAIIAAERNHVLALVKILPTDARFRGLGDSF